MKVNKYKVKYETFSGKIITTTVLAKDLDHALYKATTADKDLLTFNEIDKLWTYQAQYSPQEERG